MIARLRSQKGWRDGACCFGKYTKFHPGSRNPTPGQGLLWKIRTMDEMLYPETQLGALVGENEEQVAIAMSDSSEKDHRESGSLSPDCPDPAASHALRQPLQALTLLQGLLARRELDDRSRVLVERMGDSLKQLTALILKPGTAIVPPVDMGESDLAADLAAAPSAAGRSLRPQVYLVDDDPSVRAVIRALLEDEGYAVRAYDRCEAFLEDYAGETGGCLLVDAYLPGMSGLDLLRHLNEAGVLLPSIMITGGGDVQMAVRAMKMGATDFIEKPVGASALLTGVRQALALARDSEAELAARTQALHALTTLTRRQKEIMAMVLDGHPSKNIAADLGISQRTVENHRAAIMKKTGTRSLPALARLALAAHQGENE